MRRSIRTFALAAALAAVVACTIGAAPSGADGVTNAKHFFWAPGQKTQAQDPQATANAAANDLVYHGGNLGSGAIGVQTKPAVYLIYWGPEWASGFTTHDANGVPYSSKTLQNYVNSFFGSVGGSPWAGVQTQYCRNVLASTTNCKSDPQAEYITNPRGQLKGVWTDPTPVPDDIVTLGLAENLVERSDRGRGDARVLALQVRPERDVHRADAADDDRHRAARVLRLSLADHEPRRLRQPVPHRVRVHPVPECRMAGARRHAAAA